MILDKALQIASDQADVRAAGTYYGTNWIDLKKTGGLQMYGKEPYLVVGVGTAFVTGDSITFSIVTTSAPATDAAGTGLGTVTVEETSPVIATSGLTKDTIVWAVRLPRKLNRRYLGVKMVAVASSSFTAGTIDIDITPELPSKAI